MENVIYVMAYIESWEAYMGWGHNDPERLEFVKFYDEIAKAHHIPLDELVCLIDANGTERHASYKDFM